MQTASQALSTWNPGALTDPGAVPVAWVEMIFTRLSAQLGSKVADLYGGVPPATVKAEWADALAGFDPSEISRGLKCCQTRVFAPTLGEFLRLCRPALDAETAWLEAADGMAQRVTGETGDWTHPAVYRAARGLEHELRSGSFKEHRRMWEWRLERELRKGWGNPVPPSLMRLPSMGPGGVPGRAPTTEERQRLADLRERMGVPPAPVKP